MLIYVQKHWSWMCYIAFISTFMMLYWNKYFTRFLKIRHLTRTHVICEKFFLMKQDYIEARFLVQTDKNFLPKKLFVSPILKSSHSLWFIFSGFLFLFIHYFPTHSIYLIVLLMSTLFRVSNKHSWYLVFLSILFEHINICFL